MVSQLRFPAAPIDPAALAPALRPFGQSTMLPRAAYVDPAVFAWEQQHFFGGGWLCVGFSSILPRPGDQRAEQAGPGSVLLTRDDDRVLHAFGNTCRHRGHELLGAGESVQRNTIICPYHSWTYALDGGLRFAPGFRRGDGFDRSGWGLVELPAAEWHGLIFVDGSGGEAGPLADAFAGLDPLVAPYEPERLVIGGRHRYDATANWKILTENYHECYHCPMIHPELCAVSPPKSGENYRAEGGWVGGWMDLRDGMATMSLDGTSQGAPLRGLDAQGLRTVIYVNLFPNVLLSLHPDYVMTHRLVPLAADRTIIECVWSFAPEATARAGFDPGYAVEFWDITNRQDWGACESVQRGLTSEHARPGPLAPDEDAVYQFVTMIGRGYQGGPVWNRADSTWVSEQVVG
ncbi:MAG TPA: aromatic ring-hydroxylating dioxygenase subunit alpha [Streptosporangiaceae bacterium]|nr:aromatic ring-hydroxylating dioxygenase subunit alpha [Streptosporangiaceae bacterium]